MSNKTGVFDLTGVEEHDGTYEILPRGEYEAVVDDARFQESKNGNPMIVLRYKVDHPDYNNGNTKLFDRITLTEKALGIVKQKLRVLMGAQSLDKEYKNMLSTMSEDSLAELADNGDLIGAQIGVVVSIRNYEGKKNNNVDRILDLEDATEESGGDFMDTKESS